MTFVLILLLLGALGAVLFAVVKGLHAFANMQPNDVDDNGIPKSLALQNKMMFSRVKWQAIAIIIVALLLLTSQAG
jgi:Hypoxia induced protein conserved region